MRLSLYQPDIAQNVGSLIRLAACFGIPLDIIEPCGFPFDMKRIKQSSLDYIDHVELTRHSSWEAFLEYKSKLFPTARLVLLTTKGSDYHHCTTFNQDDILLCGRESAGVPEDVHTLVNMRVKIPIRAETRSLNVAQAATIVLSEALKQTKGFPL
jgi:tRNA (cytidine/uridine-2'-O-)-methyltransferase